MMQEIEESINYLRAPTLINVALNNKQRRIDFFAFF